MATLEQQTIITSPGSFDELSTRSKSTCSRCGGLVVKTFCISPGEGIAVFQIEVMKCLQCGDLFDATILENRWRSKHHQIIHHKGARRP